MKQLFFLCLLAMAEICHAQGLQLNDREYFEQQGVNV